MASSDIALAEYDCTTNEETLQLCFPLPPFKCITKYRESNADNNTAPTPPKVVKGTYSVFGDVFNVRISSEESTLVIQIFFCRIPDIYRIVGYTVFVHFTTQSPVYRKNESLIPSLILLLGSQGTMDLWFNMNRFWAVFNTD